MSRGRARALAASGYSSAHGGRRGPALKRVVSIAGIAVLLLLLLASLLVWNRYFRSPSIDRLSLPDNLIALESAAGRKLLLESEFIADYERLAANFVAQSRPAYCGVASSVIALNALREPAPPLSQSAFFTDAVRRIKDPWRVTLTGMSLGQLGDLLRAHGAEASVVYASDTDIDSFRSIAQRNLMTSGDFVLVNYQRAELDQVEMGHISPLAAYHAGADRFLVLDVAAYKYPPVWVATEELWNAMSAPVGSSPRTRGFVVVREGVLTRSASLSLGERSSCEGRIGSTRTVSMVAPDRSPIEAPSGGSPSESA
jgi:hypothetical protein